MSCLGGSDDAPSNPSSASSGNGGGDGLMTGATGAGASEGGSIETGSATGAIGGATGSSSRGAGDASVSAGGGASGGDGGLGSNGSGGAGGSDGGRAVDGGLRDDASVMHVGDGGSGARDSGVSGGTGATGSTGGVTTGSATAGGATTGGATTGGTGNLPAGVLGLFPAPSSRGVCPDPPLRITFSGPPTLGTSGKIQVFNAARPGTAVATVDMTNANVTDTIGGTKFNLLRPVYVDGNAVVIYLPSHALTYGQTYYVTIDQGAVTGPGGAKLTIAGSAIWSFTTAASAPASLANLTVALDGSGEFCSVQGALDAVPARNTDAVTVTLSPGTYYEVVHFTQKNNVTLRGQDRKTTIITGTNNNNLNPSTSTRSLVGVDNSAGLVIENLTIHNLTPQGGSQAEALRLQSCDKCVVRDADILSLQDTLLWSGRIYADNCYIAGNVDFVWGTGTAYFNQCEIKTVVRSGAVVQARNPASSYGYVFVDSKLTSDPGLTGTTLARIDVGTYPASHVAYINCTLGSHISPAGWQITAGTDTSQLRFWEYQSRDSAGNLVDVSKRLAASRQLSTAEAAMMRDPTVVLGGWQPP